MDYRQAKLFQHLVVRALQPELMLAIAIALSCYPYRLDNSHWYYIYMNSI
jgi:hypothetical protein